MVLKNTNNPEMYEPDNLHKYVYKALRFAFLGLDVKIYTNSLKKLDGKFIYYANHKHKMDGGLLYYLLYKNLRVAPGSLVKKELEYSSVRNFLKLADMLFLDRSNLRQSLKKYEEAKQQITREYKSFVLFPEGTRNKTENKVLDFKPGAFKLAIETHTPIVPVTIFNACDTGSNPFKKARIYIYFHPAIYPKDFLTIDTSSLAKKVQGIIADSLDDPKKYIDIIKSDCKNKKKNED